MFCIHHGELSTSAALTSSSQGAGPDVAAATAAPDAAAATAEGFPLLPLLLPLCPGLIGDDKGEDHGCDCAEVGVECVGEATPNSSGARPKTSTRASVVSQLLRLLLLPELDEGRSETREEGMIDGRTGQRSVCRGWQQCRGRLMWAQRREVQRQGSSQTHCHSLGVFGSSFPSSGERTAPS